MPLFMDVHKHVPGLTKDGVADAHQKDLAVQGKHNVKYLKYWFNEQTGDVFCLSEAPDRESAIRVHREAHGLIPDEVVEVQEGS
jgi:uncharacterized protein DUF4242